MFAPEGYEKEVCTKHRDALHRKVVNAPPGGTYALETLVESAITDPQGSVMAVKARKAIAKSHQVPYKPTLWFVKDCIRAFSANGTKKLP